MVSGLGVTDMAGLLDWLQTPAGLGLLSAAAGGMAGARKGQPWNTAGRGLASGLVGYNAAVDNERQLANTAIADKYRSMQMQEIEQKIAAQKGQQEWRAGLPAALNKTVDVKAPHEFDNPFGEDIGAGLQNVVGQAPDMQARQNYLMQPNSPYADELIKQQIMPPETVVVGRTLKNKRTGETIGHDETWKDEQAATRQQRIEELNMRLEDQRLSREQQMALRREIADQQAGLRRDAMNLRADDLAAKRDAKQETQNLTKQSQVASFDTMLGTLDRLGKHPGLARSVGVMGVMPTMPGSDSANFQAELNTFQSQAFVPMVAQLKGMGALSDAEGKKLTAAVGALDPKMGEKAFRESVGRITSEMEAARARVSGQPAPAAPQAMPEPKQTATFDLPPNAKQYEGKTLRDTKSGKRFMSVGGRWQEVK